MLFGELEPSSKGKVKTESQEITSVRVGFKLAFHIHSFRLRLRATQRLPASKVHDSQQGTHFPYPRLDHNGSSVIYYTLCHSNTSLSSKKQIFSL